MPLVALLDGVTRVDATDPDDGLWPTVWRVRPRRDLTCRECGTRLDAVERSGTRFFRHYRRVECSSVNESAEHLRLKARLAAAVRAAGWTALVEEPVPPRRADMLAVGPDEQRIAVEIQLSAQLAEDTEARTGDYAAAGVDTLWVVQDSSRLGAGHKSVRRLELDGADRVAKPLLRMRTSGDSAWDGRRHRPVTAVSWRQVAHTADLDATVAAVLNGRVVWNATPGGWVPAKEVPAFELVASAEAAARSEAAQALQRLGDSRQREADRQLAADAEADPVGYASAVEVAKRLTAAGYGEPRIVRAGAVLAHAWRVEIGATRVCIDPDPVHFDRVYRSRISYRRFTVRSNVEKSVTVASADRYDELADQLIRVHHIDQWQPEPAVLPSTDGGTVHRDLVEAAQRIVTQIHVAFGQRPPQPRWHADQHAWVWTLPDGATVALAAATGEKSPPTPTGSHRLIIYLNRYVLRRDGKRRIIWRNVGPGHLTGELQV